MFFSSYRKKRRETTREVRELPLCAVLFFASSSSRSKTVSMSLAMKKKKKPPTQLSKLLGPSRDETLEKRRSHFFLLLPSFSLRYISLYTPTTLYVERFCSIHFCTSGHPSIFYQALSFLHFSRQKRTTKKRSLLMAKHAIS